MNTNTEINLISDESLDGVTGGRSFWGWVNVITGATPGGAITVGVAPMATPWAVIGHQASSVIKHFKFW